MLVQLLRQVGDDIPQPHHLLIIVHVHYRHCVVSDLSRKVSLLVVEYLAGPRGVWRSGMAEFAERFRSDTCPNFRIAQNASARLQYVLCIP